MTANRAQPGRLPRRPRNKASRASFREEVLALHRAIFRDNQRRINASVYGYTAEFQRYEREYARSVQTYQRRARLEELDGALARADIVYVGDYHTLVQAQRSFLRLLRRLPPERPVTVALELVQGRHQKILDAFLNGELTEEAFLQGIEHESHWQFGGWENFRQILSLARDNGWSAIGIDTAGHGPAGTSVRARDKYAARRIVRALMGPDEPLVVVLIGELHVAPTHLPADVESLLSAQGRTSEKLVIYQNCHEIYWQLEARGLEHEVELVRIDRGQYCLMNTPPIVCQQSFLNWLDVDETTAQLEAPEENFKELARVIARFFDLPLGGALEEVELYTIVDLSFLARLRRRGDFSRADMKKIRSQILRSESYYIPRANMVYLGNLSINHAAEEATHFLRHICANAQEPKLLVDAFYARCLEEAIGFLGSKLINHKRKRPSVQQLERQSRSRRLPAKQRHLARLVLRHLRMEQGKRVRGMNEVYECDAETFNAVTHLLGYRLGDRLYYGLLQGRIDKKEIRELFYDNFEEEGSALTTYLYLIASSAKTHMPERF